MTATTRTTLYKTGETASASGYYDWDHYTDDTRTPAPTTEERVIYLTRGETFPPIRSCNKGAWWKQR